MNLSAVEDALEHGAMSLSGLIRKATNLLGLGGEAVRYNPPPLDGEIIYCKNNVCVHPPANLNKSASDHYPGYLNIRSQDDEVNLVKSCKFFEVSGDDGEVSLMTGSQLHVY